MTAIDIKNAENDLKPIQNQIENLYKAVKEILLNRFPNLYFYISPEGYITCWVRTFNGRDGAGIHLKYKINVNQILSHHWKYLDELNDLVEPVHQHPRDYFYCTHCGKVKSIEEYADFVMAADFCKECAKIPEVAKLIEESHKKGFYD